MTGPVESNLVRTQSQRRLAESISLAMISLAALIACSEKRDLPPAMRGTVPENVYACAELAAAEPTFDGQDVVISGEVAGCVSKDLVCPLGMLNASALDASEERRCDAAWEAIARCVGSRWRLECSAESDAGLGFVEASAE